MSANDRQQAEKLCTVILDGESYIVQIKVGPGSAPKKVLDLIVKELMSWRVNR